MKKLALLCSGLIIFSGCSFFNGSNTQYSESEKHITYIELEGILIDESPDQYTFSEYILLNENNEKIAALESNVENLQKFLKKKVILKGEKIKNSDNITDSQIVRLNVIQIKDIPQSHQIFSSEALGVKIKLSPKFFTEEKEERFHILRKSSDNQFFTMFSQKNEDWKNKFLTKGEKIIIKDFDVRRLYAGKRIQLYFPEYDIQIDYWGEKNGEYDFYQILDTLKFFEKKSENISEIKTSISTSEHSRTNKKEIQNNLNTKKILKKIEKTLGSEVSVAKIALYKTYADVEISQKTNKGHMMKSRIVYAIETNKNSQIQLKEVAIFQEGDIQSWELVSGEIPNLAGTSEIFLNDISDTNPIVLPENFALYISTHFDFQVGYPRKMYYKATGKTEDSLASVNWSTSPITSENSEIRLEILEGEISEEKIIEDENTIIFPRDKKTHFKLSALHDNFTTVQTMKLHFRNEK